ncbi:MAG: XdhC family protein [Hyphomonadaceae bacterium]|nr:XdhC family protein [Hyphomonadaceae bacterium]
MCLATLVGIDGSAPRPLGSQIAVADDGDAQGYITGGCAEASIVAEALRLIELGENRLVRYGEGSPYKDIALPCGSGIDVYFDTKIEPGLVAGILENLETRQPVALASNIANGTSQAAPYESRLPVLIAQIFTRPYVPHFQLFIAGKGPVVPALANLAHHAGVSVVAASPEPATLAEITDTDILTSHVNAPEEFAPRPLDPWCAAVTLFHDHEWEPPILTHFLGSDCFYVGALGSRKTHAIRLEALFANGVPTDQLESLKGPVGLDIQASTPTEVAISILAEIIQTYRTAERGPPRWQR